MRQRLLGSRFFSIRPKPRPIQPTAFQDNQSKYLPRVVLSSILALIAGGLTYDSESRTFSLENVQEKIDTFSQRFSSIGQVDLSDLANILLPLNMYLNRDGSRNPETDGFLESGILVRRPTFTAVLGWEDTCIWQGYDPKVGNVSIPRPGVEHLISALADCDAEIVFWSSKNSADAVASDLDALILRVIDVDRTRFENFKSFLFENHKKARAMEYAEAAMQGRQPRELAEITPQDVIAMYGKHVLRISAVLGKDHTLFRSGNRPYSLLLNNRPPEMCILVDANQNLAEEAGETLSNAGACFVVKPCVPPQEETEAHTDNFSEDANGGRGKRPRVDMTMFLLTRMLHMYHDVVTEWEKLHDSETQAKLMAELMGIVTDQPCTVEREDSSSSTMPKPNSSAAATSMGIYVSNSSEPVARVAPNGEASNNIPPIASFIISKFLECQPSLGNIGIGGSLMSSENSLQNGNFHENESGFGLGAVDNTSALPKLPVPTTLEDGIRILRYINAEAKR